MKFKSLSVLLLLTVSLFISPLLISGNEFSNISHISNEKNLEVSNTFKPNVISQTSDVFKSSRHYPTHQNQKVFRSSATLDTTNSFSTSITQNSITLDQEGEYYWDEAIPITGVVTDTRDELFPNVEVYLFLNTSDISEGNEVATATAGANAVFTFSRNFDQSDIGFWNWTVWYPDQDDGDADFGIDCFECAKIVDTGNFTLYDEISFSATRDSGEEIAPADTIQFTGSISLRNGGAVPIPIRNNYALTYVINYNEVGPTTNNSYFGNENAITFRDTYSGTTEDSATITITINGTTPYYKYQNNDVTETLTFSINTDWIFNLYPTELDGVETSQSDFNNNYLTRNNQEILVSGVFNSSSDGVDANLWNNIPINIEIDGGGIGNSNTSMDVTVNTVSNGSFSFIFILNTANFSNPIDNVVITITHTDPGELLSSEQEVKTITIKLKGEADSLTDVNYFGTLNVSKHDETLYYTNDGNDFTINGTILDEAGRAAEGVKIVFHITNQNTTGELDATTLYSSETDLLELGLSISELTTNANGYFELTFELPEISQDQKYYTVNITISNDPISDSYRWENNKNEQSSVFTFEYLNFDDITTSSIDFKFYNDTANDITLEDSLIFLNSTFYETYQNSSLNYNFTIEIKDKHGRVPIGLTLNLNIDVAFHTIANEANSRNTSQLVINSDNNGVFTFFIHNITSFDTSLFSSTHEAQFRYYFTIANSDFDIISETYGQQITIFGPDNTSMDVNDLNSADVNFSNVASESEQNITITLDIVDLESSFDSFENIRNVTIYWRATTSGGYNSTTIGDFDFSSVNWNIANMTYNPVIQRFTFTLSFPDHGHGYFFQVYFIVYDLSGHGVNADGETNGGNQWTNGLPDYDPSQANQGYDVTVSKFANITDFSNPGQPYLIQMGDSLIRQIDVLNDVLIDGKSIATGYNITSLQNNVTITLNLDEDGLNYTSVKIYYRFLEDQNASGALSLNNPVFSNDTAYLIFEMTLIQIQGGTMIFTFIIDSSQLQYNTYLDFYFNYTDGANNTAVTAPFVSTSGEVNPGLSFNLVVDKTPPIEAAEDNFEDIRIPGRENEPNEVVIWMNETLSDFNITHSVQDVNGTGLSDVLVHWYFNGSNSINFTQIYMQNGVVLFTNSSTYINGTFTFNVTLPDTFFLINSSLSYEIEVLDSSGNSLTLNSQSDPNSNSFEFKSQPIPPDAVEEPLPEPEEITEPATVIETIITTDEDGNEVTITNTTIIQPAVPEETNNALWIVAGFLGLLGLLTLYYQRNNIKDMIQQRQRRKKVQGALSDIIKEIRELGEQQKFKRAILLIWEALERVSKEIVNASRPFNVTAREFTAYLSTVTIVDRETLLTLSDTFELARYGKDNPSKEIFENAINALENTIESIIKSGARSRVTNDDEDW